MSSRPERPEAGRDDARGPDVDRRFFERQYETMSRDQMLEVQWRAFRALLQRAHERSLFYRRKFAAVGLHPGDIRSPDDVRRVPVTTKEELLRDIEEHPPYGSRLEVPTRDIVNIVETSGTSGKGREVHPRAAGDLERVFRVQGFGFVWTGIEKGTVVMLTWPISMTPASTSWFYTLMRLEANLLRGGLLSSEDKLEYMRRYGVEAIVLTPSYLTRLGELAEARGLDPRKEFPALRAIIVAGEGRSAPWVSQVEERWGAKVYEHWGCTQGGHAWTCERGMLADGRLGMMHTLPHLVMLEVVDRETRRAAESGGEGEVIVTPLETAATALIRFATNDRAIFRDSRACPCGRPFDGLECGSVGRYDEMVKVRGVNVWPATVQQVLEPFPVIREYRGEIYLDEQGREVVAIDLEFAPGCGDAARDDVRARVAAALRAEFGIGFDVRVWTGRESLESIVLNRNTGKTRRWSDRRASAAIAVD